MLSDTYEENRYSLISFESESGNILSCTGIFLGPEGLPKLGNVTFLGVNHSVTKVVVNGLEQAFKYDTLNKVSQFVFYFESVIY